MQIAKSIITMFEVMKCAEPACLLTKHDLFCSQIGQQIYINFVFKCYVAINSFPSSNVIYCT